MKENLKESLQFILQHPAVGSELVQHAQNLARNITLEHYSSGIDKDGTLNFGPSIFDATSKETNPASPQVTDEQIVRRLVEALEDLMHWQVKNVSCWNNSAYDNASRALLAFHALSAPPAAETPYDLMTDEGRQLHAQWIAEKTAAPRQEAKPDVSAVNTSAERVQDSTEIAQEAKPIAIHQQHSMIREDGWFDVSKKEYDRTPLDQRRIVYATPAVGEEAKPVAAGFDHASYMQGRHDQRIKQRDHQISLVGPVAVNGVRWDLFPGWLIDHCEGDIVTEEGLQSSLADMLASDSYKSMLAAAPQTQAPADKDATGSAVKDLMVDDIDFCAFENAMRNLEWISKGIYPDKNYDLDGGFVTANIKHAKNLSNAVLPRLNEAYAALIRAVRDGRQERRVMP